MVREQQGFVDYETACKQGDIDTSAFLSFAEEKALATRIQAGINKPKNSAKFADAMNARDALVLCNLPLAAAAARESLGWGEPRKEFSGTPRLLRSAKHPLGVYADRFQAGVIGLIGAANKYSPTLKASSDKGPARFSSYAMHSVQGSIKQYIYNDDYTGHRLPVGRHQEINSAFANSRSLPPQLTEEQQRWSLGVVAVSLEELGVEDVWADPNGTADVVFEVETGRVAESVDRALDTLSEREAGVLALRFGFGEDGRQLTLDEVGYVYGISRERVRGVQGNALSKLRHPERSRPLRIRYTDTTETGERTIVEEPGTIEASRVAPPATESGGAVLKPWRGRAVGGQYVAPERLDRATAQVAGEPSPAAQELEAWQTQPGEAWGDPVRVAPEIVVPTAEETRRATEAAKALFSETSSYQFDERFARLVNTPYPVRLIRDISRLYEPFIPAQAGQELCQHFLTNVLPEYSDMLGTDLSYNRVGDFLSRLIQLSIRSEETFDIRIPRPFAGRIGRLAVNLRRGHVVVRGSAGDYCAAGIGGMAYVEVHGNVGDYFGAGAKGQSTAIVHGRHGERLGFSASPSAYVTRG